jgi:cytochrome oxidase assembly protein ShyY1
LPKPQISIHVRLEKISAKLWNNGPTHTICDKPQMQITKLYTICVLNYSCTFLNAIGKHSHWHQLAIVTNVCKMHPHWITRVPTLFSSTIINSELKRSISSTNQNTKYLLTWISLHFSHIVHTSKFVLILSIIRTTKSDVQIKK